jgi:hypothetical protein
LVYLSLPVLPSLSAVILLMRAVEAASSLVAGLPFHLAAAGAIVHL